MEAPETECIITGTLSLILYISCIAGVAPLKYEKVNVGWKIKASKAANLYGKILVIVFCIGAIISLGSALVTIPRSFHTRTTSDRVVGVFTLALILPVGLVGAFTGMDRMHHLINCLAQIEKINVELNQFHKQVKPKEWKTLVPVIFLLILGNFTIFTDYVIFINKVILDNGQVAWLSLDIFYYIMIAFVQLVSIQFCIICTSVLSSYKILNNCLKSILKTIRDATSHVFTTYDQVSHDNDSKTYGFAPIEVDNKDLIKNLPRSTSTTIHRFIFLYCSLCDVVRTVTESHGILLVQLLLVFLLYLVIAPYHLITRLFQSSKSELFSALLQFSWVVFHFSNLAIVVEPCHRTHEEMEVTKYLVSKLIRHTPPSNYEMNTELLLFYRHLMLNDVTYSPLRMFTLSRNLIMTILGSITTYLVVILSL